MNNSNLFEYMQNPKKLKKDMDILVTYNTLCSVNEFIYNNLFDENKENINFIKHELIFSLSVKNKKKILDTIVEQFNVYKELVNLTSSLSLDNVKVNKENISSLKDIAPNIKDLIAPNIKDLIAPNIKDLIAPNIKDLTFHENHEFNSDSESLTINKEKDNMFYKKKLYEVLQIIDTKNKQIEQFLKENKLLKNKYKKYKEKYLKTKKI
jgi:hypothetical protein